MVNFNLVSRNLNLYHCRIKGIIEDKQAEAGAGCILSLCSDIHYTSECSCSVGEFTVLHLVTED